MKIKRYRLVLAILANVLASSHAQTTFTRVTTGAIASDTEVFVGATWGDFNNDGWPDLYISVYGGSNALYQNNGDGTFTRITGRDPVEDEDYHTIPSAADIDNDGNLDLIVPAGDGAPSARPCRVYQNLGGGFFSPVSGGIVTNKTGFFDNASWADYDNDGFVDLLVENSGNSDGTGGKNLLFHNNKDGTFTQITTGPLVSDVATGWGALWADYDNDRFMDLLVIDNNDSSHSLLYHNNRDGTFTRISTNAVVTDLWPPGAQGAAWGDYDNDGLPDLFVTGNNAVNRLYHNNNNGFFTNVTSGPMLKPSGVTSCGGCAWGDYDNDGYLDLFVIGHSGPNGLYHNNGDGTFTQILTEPPVTDASAVFQENALAWVDYDNDGFLDLFISRTTSSFDPASNLLYHNNGNTNGWLEVKLIGSIANRSGLGAKVRVHATIAGKSFWQLREITSVGSWDCHPLVAHFGLGNATNVDALRIEWPSGTVQEFQNVAPRQILTITEAPALLADAINGAPRFFLKAWLGQQFDIQRSPDLKSWSFQGTVTVTNLSGLTEIIDTNGSSAQQMFYRAAAH